MAYAKDIYNGDGTTTNFNVTFPYLSQDHVVVEVDEVVTSFTWVTASTIQISPAPAVDARVAIYRQTPITTPINDFENGSVLNEEQLDNSFLQTLYVTQESYDNSESAMLETTGGYFDAESKQIKNVANATDPQDATPLAQVQAVTLADKVAAAASAAAALVSETNAAASQAAALASENAAALSEANAYDSEVAAAASAASAQNAADSLIWNDVKFLSAIDSPYTVVAGDRGVLLAVDSSSGAVTINLPLISGLVAPWTVGVKKVSEDGNIITVAANAADEIDGVAADKLIQAANVGATFIADTDTAPDTWTTMNFGGSTGNMTVDNYTDGVDFTAGTTTALTLSVAPGSENNVWVTFDGVSQHHDQFTVSGTTITFSSAIPLGVSDVEVTIGTTLTIGVPSDNSVATAAIQDAAVTEAKLDSAVVAKLNKDEVIYDSGELTVAATTIDITGLDLGKLEKYEIVGHFKNDNAGAVNIYLMPSEDTTVANYLTQKTDMTGTTVSTSIASDASICQLAAGRNIAIFGEVMLAQHLGYNWHSEGITYTGAGTKVENFTGYSSNLMTGNVTGLRLQASAANGLGVGSRFIIKRKV